MSLILIVEDEADMLNLFNLIVRRQYSQIISAQTGREALDLLTQVSPDVVLLDLALPDISGREILKFVRRAPHLEKTKVIVTTAFPDLTRFASEETVDRVLYKPFSAGELLQAIQELLPG